MERPDKLEIAGAAGAAFFLVVVEGRDPKPTTEGDYFDGGSLWDSRVGKAAA